MEQRNPFDKETTVLTEEEKRNFDGITIDENTQEAYTESGVERNTFEEAWYQTRGEEDIPGVKVYTWSGLSLMTKILIGLAVVALLVALFFVGWVFLVGFVVFAVVGAILTLFKKLFS